MLRATGRARLWSGLGLAALMLFEGQAQAAELEPVPPTVVLSPAAAKRLAARLVATGARLEIALAEDAHPGAESPAWTLPGARQLVTGPKAAQLMPVLRRQAGKEACRWAIRGDGADLVPLLQAFATIGPCDLRIESAAEPAVLEREATRLRHASFVWVSAGLPTFDALSNLRRLPHAVVRVETRFAAELLRRLDRAEDTTTAVEIALISGGAAPVPVEVGRSRRVTWLVRGRWSDAVFAAMRAGGPASVRWEPDTETPDAEVLSLLSAWVRRVEPLGERRISDAALDEPLLHPR